MSIKKYMKLARYIKNWPLYFKRKSKKGKTVRFITKGHTLYFDVPPAFYYVFVEIFMEDFYTFSNVKKYLPDHSTVIDIGANAGYFTFQVLAARPHAMVYAFEPIQKNVAIFSSNIALNTGMQNSVKLHQLAVTGNTTGNVEIYYDLKNDNTVIASLFKEFAEDNTEKTIIETIPLIEIIRTNKLTRIDLLKLDCEGSEYPILYDSPKEIFDIIHCMLIEVHQLDDDKRNEKYLTNFLTINGYIINRHVGENGCPSLIVTKAKK